MKEPLRTKLSENCFDSLDIKEDDIVLSEKERKLDMFKDVLPNLDSRNTNFYSTLSDEQKKSYSPLVNMRWMSCTSGDNDYTHHKHVLDVNDFVNVDFWTLSQHPELQHKLLSVCGMGYNQRHQWIPMMKKAKEETSKISQYLKSFAPHLNSKELSLLKSNTTREEFLGLVKEQGTQDSDVKKLLKMWDEEHKK